MSEMMRNRGIIRRISTKDDINKVFDELVAKGDIDKDDYAELDDKTGLLIYIDNDNYAVINGCLFDISDAQAEYDSDEDVEEVTKLNDTDYKIHLYYYNGGTSDSEILEYAVPKADSEYKSHDDSEKELDEIMQDLITGHNFDYARKALLEWHNKNK